MAYKILYIEDLNPDSIIKKFKTQEFEVIHKEPEDFEDTLDAILKESPDALMLDFRLTSKSARFDAPVVAQSLRTKKSGTYRDIPIVLISSESNITGYYQDFTSQDLFDFVVEKKEFRKNSELHIQKIKSFIESYQKIKTEKFKVHKTLGISLKEYRELDYRIQERFEHIEIKDDVYAIARTINQELIQMTGVLIDEYVLSARLGVSIKSSDWIKLKEKLSVYQYTGILHDVFPRWWMEKITNWWIKEIDNNMPLKRLSATERVEKIKAKTDLTELQPIPLPKHAVSTRYWNACKDTQVALDTIDGLEISTRELKAWQDKEYISINAGLEKKPHEKFLKPFSREKMKTIALKLNNDE